MNRNIWLSLHVTAPDHFDRPPDMKESLKNLTPQGTGPAACFWRGLDNGCQSVPRTAYRNGVSQKSVKQMLMTFMVGGAG